MRDEGAIVFNPFTESVGTQYFVGREEQLSTFVRSLAGLQRKVPNHVYIAGLHGTGKTSYLVKVKELANEKGFDSALATLDEKHSAYEQVSTLLTAIIESVDRRLTGGANPGPLLADWLSSRPTMFLHHRADTLKSDAIKRDLEYVARVMADGKLSGAVLCIDEGQRCVPAALSAIKNAIQHLTSFLLVLSLRVATEVPGALQAGRALLDTKAADAEGDFGASRMFVLGVAMGPFDTEDEAARCIKRRLENNVIRFTDAVIVQICRMTGRIPRDIIDLSSSLYEHAATKCITQVEVPVLREAFLNKYRLQVSEVTSLNNELPEAARAILRALVSFNRPATPPEIAEKLYPGVSPDALAYALAGVRGDLRRLSESSRVVIVADDKYEIPSSIHAFALQMALGGE